ncbi:unnamed protein product [Sphenostylis stenocarpa]|uniref:Uncharacterized protein n=1 Tax=Sphenostylis stenocarpa TaxID=92480 RepID=A0AA86SLY3_9FABA|nr:unnamed protein product [Sphenostylis stenocarpa]
MEFAQHKMQDKELNGIMCQLLQCEEEWRSSQPTFPKETIKNLVDNLVDISFDKPTFPKETIKNLVRLIIEKSGK